jgi:hypothetical protein
VSDPPYAHRSFASPDNPGVPEIKGPLPPIQVPTGAGMQGCGVRTPSAAAVAEATSGLDTVVQSPQGDTEASGTASLIVAAGIPPAKTPALAAFSVPGAVPNEQTYVAPETTAIPINFLLSFLLYRA